MAKHARARSPRNHGRPGRCATVFRGGTLAVTIALCLAGSVKLFASASAASGGGHVASIGRARHARLIPPTAPHPRQGAGPLVTPVGDSGMLASAPALQQALPGIYTPATGGRQLGTGFPVLPAPQARGRPRPPLV